VVLSYRCFLLERDLRPQTVQITSNGRYGETFIVSPIGHHTVVRGGIAFDLHMIPMFRMTDIIDGRIVEPHSHRHVQPSRKFTFRMPPLRVSNCHWIKGSSEHLADPMFRGSTDRGPVAPTCGECNVLRIDVHEDQARVVNRLGFDGNEESSHIAIVPGRTVDPTLRCEAAVERFCRVVASKPILYTKIVKVASMQSIAKIVGNARNPSQLV